MGNHYHSVNTPIGYNQALYLVLMRRFYVGVSSPAQIQVLKAKDQYNRGQSDPDGIVSANALESQNPLP